MWCPRDQTSLRQVVRRQTTFELCDTCHGRWLDEGELERLVLASTKVRTNLAALTKSMTTLERPSLFHDPASEPDLDCPRCRTGLTKVRFAAGGSELTADRCETCRGLWLDSGEAGALFVLMEGGLPIRLPVAIGALLVLALGVVMLVLALRGD